MRLAYVRREQDARLLKYLKENSQAGANELLEASGVFYTNLNQRACARLEKAGLIARLKHRVRNKYVYFLTVRGHSYANCQRAVPPSAYQA